MNQAQLDAITTAILELKKNPPMDHKLTLEELRQAVINNKKISKK